MAEIPKFKTLEEAAEFWDTHDFEDYVEDTEPVALTVKIARRKKVLTIPLDRKVYEQIETLAAEQEVRVETLVASWSKERARAESATR